MIAKINNRLKIWRLSAKGLVTLSLLSILVGCGGFETESEVLESSINDIFGEYTSRLSITEAVDDGVYQNNEAIDLKAEVTSNKSLSYQWQSSVNCTGTFTNISGATQNELRVYASSTKTCYSIRVLLAKSRSAYIDIFVAEILASMPVITATPSPMPLNVQINFYANPVTVSAGIPSRLYWTTLNAETCVASGAWSGSKSLNDDEVIYLSADKTYILSCSNSTGSTESKSVTVKFMATSTPTPTPSPTGAPVITSSPTPTPVSQPNPNGSFLARCAAPGVTLCRGYDSASELVRNQNYNPRQENGRDLITLDTSIKSSGASSLKYEVPRYADNNPSGFVKEALGRNFGPGQTFYVQFRQRFSQTFLDQDIDSSGWKQFILHKAGVSCTGIQVVMQNNYTNGFPIMYSDCGASGFQIPMSNGDYILQQGAFDCRYRDKSGCLRYRANQWMTFYIKVEIGQWSRANSNITAYLSYEGEPLQKFIDFKNYEFKEDYMSDTFDFIQLTPYDSDRETNQDGKAVGYVWYDDLIVSSQPIADPVGSGGGSGTPTSTPSPSPSPTKAPTVTASPSPSPSPTNPPPVVTGLPAAPAWVATIPRGQWTTISQNTINSIHGCTTRYCDTNGGDVSNLIDDWNGGVFASKLGSNGSLVVWGGGHRGYYGNEFYAFDLATQRWRMIGTPVTQTPNNQGIIANGGPQPAHTYNFIQYQPTTNAFITFTREVDANSVRWVSGPSIFNFTTNAWTNYNLFYPEDTYGESETGGSSCYDQKRDVFWIDWAHGTHMAKYDAKTNTYTQYNNGHDNYYATAECDPTRDLYISAQGNNGDGAGIYAFDLQNPSNGQRTKISSFSQGPNPGFSWSKRRDAIIYWYNGGTVYELKHNGGSNRLSGWSMNTLGSGGTAPTANETSTYGRFRVADFSNGESVALVVNATNGAVYAFKLP